MPLVSPHGGNCLMDARQSERAMEIRAGILRGAHMSDHVFLPEMTLPNGRRADLVTLDRKGALTIIEIKSSTADFRADSKWHDYKSFCDYFYFASHPDVPRSIFPEDEGFILADAYDCEIIRTPAKREKPMSPASRKMLTLRFARASAHRIRRFALQGETDGLFASWEEDTML